MSAASLPPFFHLGFRSILSIRNIRIIPITLITLSALIALIALTIPVIHSCLEHPFFDAALGDESLLHGDEQLVEHIHRLMNQRDA